MGGSHGRLFKQTKYLTLFPALGCFPQGFLKQEAHLCCPGEPLSLGTISHISSIRTQQSSNKAPFLSNGLFLSLSSTNSFITAHNDTQRYFSDRGKRCLSLEEFTSCQQTQKCGICAMSFLILILKCKQESLCTNETLTHSLSLSHTQSCTVNTGGVYRRVSKNAGNCSCKHRPKQKGFLLVSARPVFT